MVEVVVLVIEAVEVEVAVDVAAAVVVTGEVLVTGIVVAAGTVEAASEVVVVTRLFEVKVQLSDADPVIIAHDPVDERPLHVYALAP